VARSAGVRCLGIALGTTLGMGGCGGGSTPPVSTPPNITVSVSPSLAAVVAATATSPGQSQQFTATVTGTSNSNVTWSADGVAGGNATTGTISTSGLYTPPASGGTHTITATSVANSADSASATVAVTDLAGVFTHHNDLARDGTNMQEYALTPNTVNTTSFGKLFSCAVDGAVFTQPLWVPSLSIGGGIHNVIFVATEHDTIFAFDADANPCVQYWQGTGSLGEVNLLDSAHGGTTGETSVYWDDVGCQCGVGDIYPEVGVTGTPVIDPTTNTIYLVSTSQNSSLGTFYQRLHALDLATGNEKFGAPLSIAASVPGTGDGGSTVVFNPQMENQRLGLAFAGGTVYAGWSAHEDATPWHGWLIGYGVSNNALQQVSVFNTTPNGGAGGIWAAGGAPAVDSAGNIYVSTGNGVFDASPYSSSDDDLGDSDLKLTPSVGSTANGENLTLVDSFTPDDQSCLSSGDVDLGAGDGVLLPDQTGAIPHLLVQMGKQGIVYLINRDDMGMFSGQLTSCQGSNTQIVQSFTGSPSGFYGTPAFWQNGLYFAGSLDSTGYGDNLKLFTFNPSTEQFDTTPASQSSHYYNFPGASPSVSSQGTSNGIVWAIDASAYGYANPNPTDGTTSCFQVPVPAGCAGPAVLYAYDAGNLSIEYWDSSMAPNNRDQAGNAVKFVPPTVANGKVYVSTRTEIDVYGLLP
jgi:hypothetical protein